VSFGALPASEQLAMLQPTIVAWLIRSAARRLWWRYMPPRRLSHIGHHFGAALHVNTAFRMQRLLHGGYSQ